MMMKLFHKIRALLVAGAAIGCVAVQAAEIEVGYLPIMPMSQLFIMEQEGWTKDAGITFSKTRFSDGPAMVQALASGKLDVAYVGIGPVMVARANGVDLRVVASNVVEQVAFIAGAELAPYLDGPDLKAGFAKFTKDKGHKARIASLPTGSVPDTVLRHWLIKVVGVSVDEVEIVGMGANRVQQALLSKSVDGASILEPTVTIVTEKDNSAKVIAYGSQMWPNQPGAVLAVRERLIKSQPETVKKLVELHAKATKFLISNPKQAAQDIYNEIGAGLIPVEMVEKSITSPYSRFTADPRKIVGATQEMHDFQSEIGTLRKPVAMSELFDTSYFEAVVGAE